MKLPANSNTYTADGKVEAGGVFEVDDKAGEAMVSAKIAKAAPKSAEVSKPAEAPKAKK
jgi:hypothetical protein